MIKGTFRLGGELVDVIVDNNNLLFSDSSGTITTIEGIKLNKQGVIKQYPDLENDNDWKIKCIKRFKEYFDKMKTENEKIDYVKNELKIYGYEPLFKQRAGFRPTKL